MVKNATILLPIALIAVFLVGVGAMQSGPVQATSHTTNYYDQYMQYYKQYNYYYDKYTYYYNMYNQYYTYYTLYNSLKSDYDSMKTQNQDLQSQVSSYKQEIDRAKQQLDSINRQATDLRVQYDQRVSDLSNVNRGLQSTLESVRLSDAAQIENLKGQITLLIVAVVGLLAVLGVVAVFSIISRR